MSGFLSTSCGQRGVCFHVCVFMCVFVFEAKGTGALREEKVSNAGGDACLSKFFLPPPSLYVAGQRTWGGGFKT